MHPDADIAELDRLSDLCGMPVLPEFRAGVFRQWRLNQAFAAPLLAFELPEDSQPAPVFRP